MTNSSPKKVYNLLILDESGSMQTIKQSVINGFNEIIQSIRHAAAKESGLEQWIHFWSFNSEGMKEQIPLSRVSALTELNADTYQPDAMTPLYDAIGRACTVLRKATEQEPEAAFLVTILTDGEENDSKEYTAEAIRQLIAELKTRGWVFTYVGANQDVEQVAVQINITNTMAMDASDFGVASYVSKDSKARARFYQRILHAQPGAWQEDFFGEGGSRG